MLVKWRTNSASVITMLASKFSIQWLPYAFEMPEQDSHGCHFAGSRHSSVSPHSSVKKSPRTVRSQLRGFLVKRPLISSGLGLP